LEEEYDKEMKKEIEKKLSDKVDMRKLLKEHDAGTERLKDMTSRRSKLMDLIKKRDFKSFHMELRPQQQHAQ
jgi:hypothetical protein